MNNREKFFDIWFKILASFGVIFVLIGVVVSIWATIKTATEIPEMWGLLVVILFAVFAFLPILFFEFIDLFKKKKNEK